LRLVDNLQPRKLTGLKPPEPGCGMYEPSVAIDPADPSRAAVVAVYPNTGNQMNKRVWCWRTDDAGQRWYGSRVQLARSDEGAGDPLVGYGPNGDLIVVAIDMRQDGVDAFNEMRARTAPTRLTSLTIEEQNARDEEERTKRQAESGGSEDTESADYGLCIARSDDHGETWSSMIVPGSLLADKPDLAIDNQPRSPFAGHVYLVWAADAQLMFARSIDGGRTTEPPVPVGAPNGFAWARVVVGPDGRVHIMWHNSLSSLPSAAADAATGIFYTYSDDGGASFSQPAVVADHAGPKRVFSLNLVIEPQGSMFGCWSESDALPTQRGEQPRATIRWIQSIDGQRWSAPAALVADLSPEISQGLPAAASTDGAWHVVSYDAGDDSMSVRLYSAPHDDVVFRPMRALATRRFGADDIFLGSSMQIRGAGDIAIVGDYVGFAGAGSNLVPAIVLPENDEVKSALAVYAGVIGTSQAAIDCSAGR
jgi:hypothetical protein